METRANFFERKMKELPNVLVDTVSDYTAPVPGNRQIAYNGTPANESAYIGIKDIRYNDLPEYQKDLAIKIWKYGTFEVVKNTLDRWYSKDIDQKWDNFIINYPYDKCIKNPYSIKKILEQEKWVYIGGTRLTKMRNKRRISKKRNTKKRISKKRISKK